MNVRVQMVSDLIAELAKDYPDLIKNMDINPRQLPTIPIEVRYYPDSIWVIEDTRIRRGYTREVWIKEEEKEPEEFEQVFNIENKSGVRMLCYNVCKYDADVWLKHYQETYPAGKPYPNTEGYYPDFGFRIVRV